MKKLILIYGLISGFLCSAGFLMMGDDLDMDKGMVYGYTSMIIALSLIFVATYQYRKRNGGITFGKAFLIGLYISLIASTIYVVIWLITYYNFRPDFMEKYSACVIEKVKASGASPEKVQAEIANMNQMKEYYKNPLFVILMTYAEVLPLGLVASLISALVFKRKTNTI